MQSLKVESVENLNRKPEVKSFFFFQYPEVLKQLF